MGDFFKRLSPPLDKKIAGGCRGRANQNPESPFRGDDSRFQIEDESLRGGAQQAHCRFTATGEIR
jgi:hypothetical protein